MDLVLPLTLGPVFGMMWINTSKHKKLRKWSIGIEASNLGPVICSDIGSLTDANDAEQKGVILLTEDALLFKPLNGERQKQKIDLSEIDASITKSWVGFFKAPSGIKLTSEKIIKPAKFPRHWMYELRSRKNASLNPETA